MGCASRCASLRAGVPVLGTCAGMIMLDRDHLGVLDMRCERNAFGRQVHSFEGDVELEGFGPRSTASSSARRGWPSRGAASGSWARSARTRSRSAAVACWRWRSTPS